MLDPITAMSLVGNLAQVVGLACNILSEGNHIFRAAKGALQENKDAEEVASDLAELTSFMVESQNEWSKAQHGRVLLDPDDAISARMEDYRQEIQTHFLVALRKDSQHKGAQSEEQFAWTIEEFNSLDRKLQKALDGHDTIDSKLSRFFAKIPALRLRPDEAGAVEGPGTTTDLHKATAAGETVKALLEYDVDTEAKDDSKRDASFYARDCPAAIWLLRYGPDIERRSGELDNGTGLMHMAWLGDVEGTKFFLEQKAKTDVVNHKQETALVHAACLRDAQIAELLIANGASIDDTIERSNPMTPLLVAARFGRIEVATALIKHRANKEASFGNGNTALLEACAGGHTQVARLLIDSGSNVHAVNNYGPTALSMAVKGGHADLVKALLSEGADPNKVTDNDAQRVKAAARRRHEIKPTSFLEYDADMSVSYSDCSTALRLAARHGHLERVRLLLDHDADKRVQQATENGYVAMCEAAFHGHAEVVELVFDRAVKWTGVLMMFPALCDAASNGQDAIVRLLHHRGSNIEERGRGGRKHPALSMTALIRAANRGHGSTVRALIELGAKIDAEDECGQTALCHAVSNGHIVCVGVLLEKGANVNVQNFNGITALALAVRVNSVEMVEMLVNARADLQLRDWFNGTALSDAFHGMMPQVEIERLLGSTQSKQDTLYRLQSERHSSEIAAHMNEIYK